MFICNVCEKSFSNYKTLKKHLKTHKNIKSERNSICQICKASFHYIQDLRQHLHEKHNIEQKREIFEISTYEEFLIWKDKKENETNSQYIVKSKTNNTTLFDCRRSGKTRGKKFGEGESRKRKCKTQGSCKIGFKCTSQIFVRKTKDNAYNVTYFETHHGHENEIKHIRLKKAAENELANRLLAGITPNRKEHASKKAPNGTQFEKETPVEKTNLDMATMYNRLQKTWEDYQKKNQGTEEQKEKVIFYWEKSIEALNEMMIQDEHNMTDGRKDLKRKIDQPRSFVKEKKKTMLAFTILKPTPEENKVIMKLLKDAKIKNQ